MHVEIFNDIFVDVLWTEDDVVWCRYDNVCVFMLLELFCEKLWFVESLSHIDFEVIGAYTEMFVELCANIVCSFVRVHTAFFG